MIEEFHMFASIVEHSSMNKAAALLNLSQPALSRKLAKLEEEIGAKLFERVGKRLELTRVGQLTYEYAVNLRKLHRRYMDSVAEYTAAGRTSITIGASLTTLQTTLPDFIKTLNASHPEFDIKAVTGKTHEIVTLVRDNKADIAIVASMIEDSQLHCVPLFDDHLLLVIPTSVAVTHEEPLSIEDLNGLPMILFSKGTWYRKLTDEVFAKYHLQPDVRMEIDSFEAIVRLLHTCRAATLLPHSYMRKQLLADNELVVVPIRELEETKRTTCLIHNDPSDLHPAVRRWISELSQ
ncbi:DNA-binding transcriptional LysR family regulator [Paenibacillus sp. BK033]|uniref:LysR family transcriptional regulator n=1 Tax=Paenibacillus sp. BK033 TaxID=2512133 RepID=UPI00104BD3FD|nr:LysR family transcriptional regulator [Paenibacillus sp. BK033]TCM97983.1 DNA-binding transcriptional LysR family regulator [Paenibacillus sp. BK033]